MTSDPAASSGIHVRPARGQDLPALGPIELAAATRFPAGTLPPALANPMPLAELQACLASSQLWVADEPGRGLVGFIAASTHGRCLHVLEMDVLPARSRQGIGTRLLHHVCQVARQRGHAHVTLTTFAHLPWNAAFYAANGFVAVSGGGGFAHLAAALRDEQDSGLAQRIAMIKPIFDNPPRPPP